MAYAMWMKSLYLMPRIKQWQCGKKLSASWPCHTPLTSLLDTDLSPIDHLWGIRDRWVHDLYLFPAATLPELERWIKNGNAVHRGRGANVYPLSFLACTKAHKMH